MVTTRSSSTYDVGSSPALDQTETLALRTRSVAPTTPTSTRKRKSGPGESGSKRKRVRDEVGEARDGSAGGGVGDEKGVGTDETETSRDPVLREPLADDELAQSSASDRAEATPTSVAAVGDGDRVQSSPEDVQQQVDGQVLTVHREQQNGKGDAVAATALTDGEEALAKVEHVPEDERTQDTKLEGLSSQLETNGRSSDIAHSRVAVVADESAISTTDWNVAEKLKSLSDAAAQVEMGEAEDETFLTAETSKPEPSTDGEDDDAPESFNLKGSVGSNSGGKELKIRTRNRRRSKPGTFQDPSRDVAAGAKPPGKVSGPDSVVSTGETVGEEIMVPEETSFPQHMSLSTEPIASQTLRLAARPVTTKKRRTSTVGHRMQSKRQKDFIKDGVIHRALEAGDIGDGIGLARLPPKCTENMGTKKDLFYFNEHEMMERSTFEACWTPVESIQEEERVTCTRGEAVLAVSDRT